MLTISGLGFDFEVSKDGGGPAPTPKEARPTTKAARYATTTQPSPGKCVAPDVMGEFGCLTPIVPMPGSSTWQTIYGCPPGSQPYSATHCLRTDDVAAKTAAAAQAAADAAAKAQANADAAAAAAAQAAAEQASAAAQAAANEEAARQQAYADAVVAAAQQAIDAWMASHPDGTEPSPGMKIDDTGFSRTCPDGTVIGAGGSCPTIMATKKTPWLLIGAGVLGAAALVTFLARR